MAHLDLWRSNGSARAVVVLTVLIVAVLKLNSLISCIPFWPLHGIVVSAFLGLKYTADNETAIHTQTTTSVKFSCPHFRGSMVYTSIQCSKQGIDCMVLQWDRTSTTKERNCCCKQQMLVLAERIHNTKPPKKSQSLAENNMNVINMHCKALELECQGHPYKPLYAQKRLYSEKKTDFLAFRLGKVEWLRSEERAG